MTRSVITLRLSDAELAQIDRAAAAARRTRSDWARLALLDASTTHAQETAMTATVSTATACLADLEDLLDDIVVYRDGEMVEDYSVAYVALVQDLDGTLPSDSGVRVDWSDSGAGMDRARRVLDTVNAHLGIDQQDALWAMACRGEWPESAASFVRGGPVEASLHGSRR